MTVAARRGSSSTRRGSRPSSVRARPDPSAVGPASTQVPASSDHRSPSAPASSSDAAVRPSSPVRGHPPPVPVEAVGAAVVPPWRVVDSSLPRVAHQEQARPVAGPLVNQEADAGDRRVHHLVRRWRPGTYQLGDSVPVHGRLGDRRTVPTAPEVLMGAGRLHVVHVGDEPGRGLWTEHLGQLSLGAPALAQCLPDEHVEAGVPQPLPRVDPRVGGCVPFRHPVVLQQPSHGGPEVNERWVRETIATHQEASLHDRLLPARAHRRGLGSSTELVRCAHPDGFRPDLGGR